MRAAIAELGGAVVPKFTWSCPKDAVWMTLDHTLACRSPDEVLLLLKSSDRVAHDICEAWEGAGGVTCCLSAEASPPAGGRHSAAREGAGSAQQAAAALAAAGTTQQGTQAVAERGSTGCPSCTAAQQPRPPVQHVLALRRWHDLRPGREFRCFVNAHQLVGVSQRDVTEYFPFLVEEKPRLQQRILDFHTRHIQGRFPLPHYTYDVYVAETADAVKLIDFNPVGGTTSPLLFSWEELPYGELLGLEAASSQATTRRDGLPESPAEETAAAESDAAVEDGSSSRGAPGGDKFAAAGEPAPRADSCCFTQAEQEGSYLRQLRQVQALSLSDDASLAARRPAGRSENDQEEGQPCPVRSAHAAATNACSKGAAGPAAAHSCNVDSRTEQAQQAQRAVQHLGGQGPGPDAAALSALLQFRIIERPADAPLRPTTMAYGVPYDFIDDSTGGPLDQLVKQTGGGLPSELLAVLQAQGQ
ncbi:hypothetical protein N2152v2_002541 [Parachlorella kessleri]